MPRSAASSPPVRLPRPSLPRTVLVLAAVSLFTDVSSEMIYPLIPAFLATTLGASATWVGAIEGAAETVASLLKFASGWWSDRLRSRKPLVVAGYALASFVRPLVGIAQSAGQVFGIRIIDRIGKGIRTAPRDALVADAVSPGDRGRAFGFHRAADHVGAVIGPLVAFALIEWGDLELRTVFLLAGVPAVVAMAVLIFGLKEERRPGASRARSVATAVNAVASGVGDEDVPAPSEPPPNERAAVRRGASQPTPAIAEAVTPSSAARPSGTSAHGASDRLGRRFYAYIAVVLLFTLGNSTDAFLLLRARDLGISVASIPLLWAALSAVKALSAVPLGALSDRVGRRPLIIGGWSLYALVYLGFALASAPWEAWALFLVYGIFFGLTEGVEKAVVADLAPAHARGRAYGWYNLAIGLGALPASLIFGAVWDGLGAPAAFVMGAGFAAVAAVAVWIVLARPPAMH